MKIFYTEENKNRGYFWGGILTGWKHEVHSWNAGNIL